MKKFVGDINIFLNALGEKQGSNLILKAISIVATDFEVEYFECDNIQHTYFHFFKRGVDFVFSKNNDSEFLESIFFYVNKYNNEYYEYPFLEQLFLELDNKFTQNDIFAIIINLAVDEKIGDISYRELTKKDRKDIQNIF